LVDNTTFTGSPSLIPGTLQSVTFTGDAALPDWLTVNGNLTVAGSGNLDLNGNTVTVTADVLTQGSGTITMRNAFDLLTIQRHAVFAGGNMFGPPHCDQSVFPFEPCLNAGQINLAGNLTQLGPEKQSFHVNEGGTTVNFNGTSAVTTQKISFANPRIDQSHLAVMMVSNVNAGIELTSDVVAYDDLQTSGVGTQKITGNGNTLEVGALNVFDATFDRVLLVWDGASYNGSFEVFGTVTFQGYLASDIVIEVRHNLVAVSFPFERLTYITRPSGDNNPANNSADPGEGFYLWVRDFGDGLTIDWDVFSGPGCDGSEILEEGAAFINDLAGFCGS
jgi:hypothetical protein